MFTLPAMLKHSLCCVFTFLLFSQLLYAQRLTTSVADNTIPNRVVYKLKPQHYTLSRTAPQGNSINQVLKQIGAKEVQQKFPEVAAAQAISSARKAAPTVDISQIYELQYGAGYTFEEIKTALMSTGQVAYVEPLYIREPFHQPNDPAADSTKTTQFYLKQVQAYGGWAVEKGDTNVVIGVLDTGFRLSHQDLKSKVKHNYSDRIDGVDNDGDGLIDNFSGWDFADNDNDVSDDSPWRGHGTAVAGVAAGATNNGTGMAGLGYNVMFMPIKVFSSYPNGRFGGYEAIVYAANKGCKVINLSWGGTGFSEFEQDIINYAVLEKDVLIIASGGNTNAFVDIYPAAYKNVVSVGGANNQDGKYKDHTYNYNIDLISPSANIYSTSVASDTKYGGVWGTSFSAPTVAGGAALVRKHFPELNARQVAERLRATTDYIYSLEENKPYLEMLGTGRFNLKKALRAQNPVSARCISFTPRQNQSMSAGNRVSIDAEFINFLAPTSALNVTLTSLSPFVTIEQGNAALGSVGTMGSAGTANQPFIIKISDQAPRNRKVYLRLGFTDGTYTDFQHFELFINPSYTTLTSNNFHLTLNSEGNIGYDGLNLKQGVGATYKGGKSLLFEGGLMLATDAGVVADNIHNQDWQNDRNFRSLSLVRHYYNTPLADQEIHTLMETAVEGHPEVRVKTRGFSWASIADLNYVVVEYQITNRSSEAISRLHIGLFADWDIGNYTQNAIGWDEKSVMGYAYNKRAEMPYTGIKLLTPENEVIYHAIDNIGTNDSTVTVDDGFSNEEKFKVISNGKSRLRAGGSNGNSVSHVIGATAMDLAPGQTKTIAFALMAGDNLAALQQNSQAAQAKYKKIKTGPAPVASVYQACPANAVVISPEGGSYFNFYADTNATELLGSGRDFTLTMSGQTSTVYVANADSLYMSSLVPMRVEMAPEAVASFAVAPGVIQIGKPFKLEDKSQHAVTWEWDFGDGTSSTSQHPAHTYQRPGNYTVKLKVTNGMGCSPSYHIQVVDVYDVAPKLYPNPASDYLTLNLCSPLTQSKDSAPELQLTDMAGKAIAPVPYTADHTSVRYDLSHLTAGIYIARITYQGNTYVERVLVNR